MVEDSMRDTKRAKRRAQQQRVKARVMRILRGWAGREGLMADPRKIGVYVSTHCRPCTCYACTDNSEEMPRPRERAFYDPDTFAERDVY